MLDELNSEGEYRDEQGCQMGQGAIRAIGSNVLYGLGGLMSSADDNQGHSHALRAADLRDYFWRLGR